MMCPFFIFSVLCNIDLQAGSDYMAEVMQVTFDLKTDCGGLSVFFQYCGYNKHSTGTYLGLYLYFARR